MSGLLDCRVTGSGTISASLDQLPSHGVRSGSRDLDVTGQHTRSFDSQARSDLTADWRHDRVNRISIRPPRLRQYGL